MTFINAGHVPAPADAGKDNNMKEATTPVAERKFEIIAKKRTNHATGHQFTSYAVKTNQVTDKGDPVWMDLRFTKEVSINDIPKSHSFIFVDADKCNIDKSNKYPKLWVQKINRVEMIDRPVEDLNQYFDE